MMIPLSQVLNLPVKEVFGFFSDEYNEPVFRIHSIEMLDGTHLFVEGEHDFPYLDIKGPVE